MPSKVHRFLPAPNEPRREPGRVADDLLVELLFAGNGKTYESFQLRFPAAV